MTEPFTRLDMLRAYYHCIRNKKSSPDYLRYLFEKWESDIFDLLSEVNGHTYKPGRSVCFVVIKPKPREVFAGNFRDRIVHHLVVGELESYFEQRFIPNVFNCRNGKWPLVAMKTLQKDVMHSRRDETSHFLQMDIKGFFMSIDKRILLDIFDREFARNSFAKSDTLRYLLGVIIGDDPTDGVVRQGRISDFSSIHPSKSLFGREKGTGLPIGNLTSQFFANVYMNELDQFVKRTLRVKYYYRYVDDFILLGTKQELSHFHDAIREFLSRKLGLSLAEQKTKLLPVSYGIDFVGYILKNRADLLPRKRNIGSFLAVVKNGEYSSHATASRFLARVNSYLGFLSHAKTYRLRQQALKALPGTTFSIWESSKKIILN